MKSADEDTYERLKRSRGNERAQHIFQVGWVEDQSRLHRRVAEPTSG